MKKIYFLVDNISYFGGAERVVINLANEFIKINKVEIISLNASEKIKYAYDNKITFVDLEIKGKNSFTRKIEIIKKLNKKKYEDNSIFIGIGAWNGINIFFIKNKKIKKIASEHLAYEKVPMRVKILRVLTYRYLDGVFCLTQAEKDKYKKLNKKVYAIPNFINKANLFKTNLKNKKMISIGRLHNQKGYDKLLNIWKEIELENKEWSLDIYGDGEEKEKLLKLKKELNLERLSFKGETNEVYKKLSEASIYLMTSRYEGFGLVLLEAMSCNVPCISYDCPSGPSDLIIEEKNGFLIENNNKNLFIKKIKELMENKEKLMRFSKNTKLTNEKFGKKRILKMWYDAFKEIEKEN